MIEGIALPRPVDERAFVRRWRLERLYGAGAWPRASRRSSPDVVMCANAPLDAVRALDAACHAQGIPWDASKPDGTPRKLLDVGKLHALGWTASIPFREGVAATYQWYLQHLASAKAVA